MTDLGTLLVLGGGGLLVLQGWISIGDLLVLSAYLRIMYSPLRQLGKLSNTFARATASGERVMELLQTVPVIDDAPNAQPAQPFQGAITFDRVNFGYDAQHPVLHDLSFKIRSGMMVALVGHTGAGKSSMLHLIQRFYDPTEGQIRIDGRDIRDYTLESLRQQIALVPQEPMLFRASIRENIAYGRLDATQAEIEQVAHSANAHEFIEKLPERYNTLVGERGVKLSGGQRQRIAIARALLLNPTLLLLDDSTSAVDAETEYRIQQALQHLMANRTSFIIAQRLSTVRNAGKILLIDGGHLVAQGTHEVLQQTSCLYCELLESQLMNDQQVATVA